MDNAYNLLKQRSVPKPTTERSESAIYGELIGKRLEKLELDERDYVMHQIDNVTYEAKMRFKKNSYVITFASTQLNPNSSQIPYTTTCSPSTSESTSMQYPSAQANPNSVHIFHVTTPPAPSTSTKIPCSGPPSAENYLDECSAKGFYEIFE